MLATHFDPFSESLEVNLFAVEQIPLYDLAFLTFSLSLRLFFAARPARPFRLHTSIIRYEPRPAA